MQSSLSSFGSAALNLFVVLAFTTTAAVASAQLGDALKGAAQGAAQGAADGSGATEKAAKAGAAVDKGQQAVGDAHPDAGLPRHDAAGPRGSAAGLGFLARR